MAKAEQASQLIFKRAPIGWNDDDYDVLADGKLVGRIFKVPIGPQDRTWMWANGRNRGIHHAVHGYEPTCEDAMAAFAKSWRG